MKGGYCRLQDRSVELSKAHAVMGKFWCLKHGGEDIGNGRIKHAIIGSHKSVQKGELVYKGVEVTHAANAHCAHTDFGKSIVFYTHTQTP
jgi:hypothetical protein